MKLKKISETIDGYDAKRYYRGVLTGVVMDVLEGSEKSKVIIRTESGDEEKVEILCLVHRKLVIGNKIKYTLGKTFCSYRIISGWTMSTDGVDPDYKGLYLEKTTQLMVIAEGEFVGINYEAYNCQNISSDKYDSFELITEIDIK